MRKLFAFFRTTTFLLLLIGSLVMSTISLGVWVASTTAQVATLTAGAAASVIAQRKAVAAAVASTRAKMLVKRKKAVARAVLKTKAKARMRRVMVAVPLAGIAAAAAFERQDYLAWKEDNPGGDLNAYSCEVAQLSGEVVEEVLAELPEQVRPGRNMVLGRLPKCVDKTVTASVGE